MADLYGAAAIPLAVTTPAGDPALRDIVDYCKATLNAYAGAAWLAIDPRGGTSPVVRAAHTHNPRRGAFVDSTLPALYAWRERGTFGDHAETIRRREDTIQLLWVYPPSKQEIQQVVRDTFGPALAATLDAALERGRDPSWVKAADTDVTAPAIAADTDSIKLAFPTSASPQTYSGAQLDGIVGGAVMNPRRSLTLTQSAVVGGYSTSAVTVTYETWYGGTATLTFTPAANGGVTLTTPRETKRTISIAFPAQPGVAGTWQFGTAARAGRGSVLLATTKMREIRLVDWKVDRLEIQVTDAQNRQTFSMPYDAIAMQLRVREELVVDLSDTTRFHPHESIENDFVRDDDSLIEQQELPDDGA